MRRACKRSWANDVSARVVSRAFRGGTIVALVTAFAASGITTCAVAQQTTHTIAMDGTRFVPESLTVKRGDRVVWVNKDPFPHTATAAGRFDSKAVAAGGSWSFTTNAAGEFAYVCTLHPGMKGVLIVK